MKQMRDVFVERFLKNKSYISYIPVVLSVYCKYTK